LALLQSGDEVLIPSNSYSPNLTLAKNELMAWGITHQIYDAMNPADLAAKLSNRTKLVWLEAAGSVTMEFPDLIALTKLCKDHGVMTVLDNTWGAGVAFNAFTFDEGQGVNLTIHALTKYPSGNANLLMGSVVCRDAALYHKLKLSHMRMGWGVGANDCEMVLAGLHTLALRYAAQDKTARALAEFLQTKPEIAQVLHPALKTGLGHAAWKQICNDQAAGIFSVVFKPAFTQLQVDAFCEALKLFKLGYSWAGPISLVVPYQLETIRPVWPVGIASGTVVRFCIGLEDVHDLQHDLAQALVVLKD
jgi:cystathionine beta-lyase